jgi:hypothetical protein
VVRVCFHLLIIYLVVDPGLLDGGQRVHADDEVVQEDLEHRGDDVRPAAAANNAGELTVLQGHSIQVHSFQYKGDGSETCPR